MAASKKGINRIAKIAPRTDPIKVGPSRMLFCIALPKYEPTAILTNTTIAKVVAFRIEDS